MNQLINCSTQVLELQAERSALKSRNSDLQNKCNTLERQLVEALTYDDHDEDTAVNMENGLVYRYTDSDHSGLNNRTSGGGNKLSGLSGSGKSTAGGRGKVIHEIEKYGVRAGPGVTRAVNVVDGWTLGLGKYLRSYPLVRLGKYNISIEFGVWRSYRARCGGWGYGGIRVIALFYTVDLIFIRISGEVH